MFLGFSCSDKQEHQMTAADCHLASFLVNYSENYKKADVYFIRGIATKLKHEGGLNIKLIEDLKGNFPKNVTTITVWGGYNPGQGKMTIERLDNFSIYKNQDMLLMLLTPSTIWKYNSEPEKKGDYATIGCAYSVLKLSNGYVTGVIIPDEDRWYPWKDMSEEEFSAFWSSLSEEEQQSILLDTMSWEDLQKKLQEILESNKP